MKHSTLFSVAAIVFLLFSCAPKGFVSKKKLKEKNKKGYITKVEMVKAVSKELDKEAVRVIKAMDRWYPAFLNKKPIPVRYTQPLKFMLK